MVSANAFICIFTTLICPPIGLIFSLLALLSDFEDWRIYIICMAYAMGVFAYCYEPTVMCDLVRYLDFCDHIAGISYSEAISVSQRIGYFSSDPLYSFVALCWGVAQTGDNRLLPMISTFFVYYTGFYITCRTCDELTEEKNYIVFYIFLILLMINFFSIVNNVRNVLAFCMMGLAIYRDLGQKKRNLLTLVMYVIPIYMHLSAMLFLGIRLVVPYIRKTKWLGLLLCAFLPSVVILLSTRLANVQTSNAVLSRLIRFVNSGNEYYTNDQAAWAVTVAHSGAQRLFKIGYISVAVVQVGLYLLWGIRERKNELPLPQQGGKEKTIIIDLSFICSLLTLSCIPMVMPEYWRFVSIAILFGGGLMVLLPVYADRYKGFIWSVMAILAGCLFVTWFRNLWMYSDVITGVARSFFGSPLILILLKMFGKSIEWLI